MEWPLYQVDAFTESQFRGNPAAVCLLEKWPEDELLQQIAAENNLAETAFMIKYKDYYQLRWFTPETEIDLCGHATLASGYVVLNELEQEKDQVRFKTCSGELEVYKKGDLLSMIFPSRPARRTSAPDFLVSGLGREPAEILKSRDYLVIYNTEEEIKDLQPDLEALKKVDATGIIVSAIGKKYDFVSRFFAPSIGVPEDPVTGSAHCTLVPYWAKKLGKEKLQACQLSKRGGELECLDLGDKVKISGKAVLYLKGMIYL